MSLGSICSHVVDFDKDDEGEDDADAADADADADADGRSSSREGTGTGTGTGVWGLDLVVWTLLQPRSSPSAVMRYEETIPSVQILLRSGGMRDDRIIFYGLFV